MTREEQRTEGIISLARFMSNRNDRVWYVCKGHGGACMAVSDADIRRYEKLGYKVVCAFYDGVKYGNVLILGGKMHFIEEREVS